MIDSTSLITHSALRESDPAPNPGRGERHHFPADKASPYFRSCSGLILSPPFALPRKQATEGRGRVEVVTSIPLPTPAALMRG